MVTTRALLRQPDIATPAARLGANFSMWAGSLLVASSGVLHLFLWLNYGYRNIHVIGPLFLAQAAVGWALALLTCASRHWLAALAEIGYALASAGGLVISINIGLFGWQEASNGPWVWQALAIELGAVAVLLPAVVLFGRAWLAGRSKRRLS